MKKISFINGSPNGSKSFTFKLLSQLGNIIQDEKNIINVKFKGKYEEEVFENLANSHAIVISFPLYTNSLPGVLIDFIQQFYEYSKNMNINEKGIRVYAIVNCGFPEPQINEQSIKVIENFCNKTGLDFRFAVSIGGGKFLYNTKDLFIFNKDRSNINKAFKQIKSDIYGKGDEEKSDNIMIKPFLPKALVLYIAGKNWYLLSKKNGLRKDELFKKPYI